MYRMNSPLAASRRLGVFVSLHSSARLIFALVLFAQGWGDKENEPAAAPASSVMGWGGDRAPCRLHGPDDFTAAATGAVKGKGTQAARGSVRGRPPQPSRPAPEVLPGRVGEAACCRPGTSAGRGDMGAGQRPHGTGCGTLPTRVLRWAPWEAARPISPALARPPAPEAARRPEQS